MFLFCPKFPNSIRDSLCAFQIRFFFFISFSLPGTENENFLVDSYLIQNGTVRFGSLAEKSNSSRSHEISFFSCAKIFGYSDQIFFTVFIKFRLLVAHFICMSIRLTVIKDSQRQFATNTCAEISRKSISWFNIFIMDRVNYERLLPLLFQNIGQ